MRRKTHENARGSSTFWPFWAHLGAGTVLGTNETWGMAILASSAANAP